MSKATLQCGMGPGCHSWLKRAVSSSASLGGNTHTHTHYSVNKTATSRTNHRLTGTTSLLSSLSQRKTNPSPLQTLGSNTHTHSPSLFHSFSLHQKHPHKPYEQLMYESTGCCVMCHQYFTAIHINIVTIL